MNKKIVLTGRLLQKNTYLSANQRKKRSKMLEFCKQILTKVSFDSLLFRKELEKSIRWLNGEELGQLKQWCLDNFSSAYREIILMCFKTVSLA